MDKKKLFDNLDRQSKPIFLTLASSSGYLSYVSILDMVENVPVAVAYAVAVAAAIYLLSTSVKDVLPKLSEENRRGIIFVIIAFIISTIGVSAYTNLLTLAGDTVKEIDARNHIELVQKTLSDTSLSVLKAKNVVTSLLADKKRYLDMAEGERKSGLLSGSAGSGMLTSSLSQAANILESCVAAISSKEAEITTLIDESTVLLSQMRDILDGQEDIENRLRDISKLNRELQSKYEQLFSISLGEAIINSVSPLDSVVTVAVSGNSRLRAKQEKIIKKIKEDFEKTKAKYLRIADSTGLDNIEFPTWEPNLHSVLVVKYAKQIAPLIVAAILIDLAPYMFAFILVFLRKQIEHDENVGSGESSRQSLKDLEKTFELFKKMFKDDDERKKQ